MPSILSRLSVHASEALGQAYLLYHTFKAIGSHSQQVQQKWLTFWIIYSPILLAERLPIGLRRLPLYHPLKFLFLLWLTLPRFSGSDFLYRRFVMPLLSKHESAIDMRLSEWKHQAQSTTEEWSYKGWLQMKGFIMKCAIQFAQLVSNAIKASQQQAAAAATPPASQYNQQKQAPSTSSNQLMLLPPSPTNSVESILPTILSSSLTSSSSLSSAITLTDNPSTNAIIAPITEMVYQAIDSHLQLQQHNIMHQEYQPTHQRQQSLLQSNPANLTSVSIQDKLQSSESAPISSPTLATDSSLPSSELDGENTRPLEPTYFHRPSIHVNARRSRSRYTRPPLEETTEHINTNTEEETIYDINIKQPTLQLEPFSSILESEK